MLFCNIEALRDSSSQFISKYDSLQNDHVLVNNYLDLLADHVNCTLRKSVVKYCSNINHQREMFQHLMNNNSDFAEKIAELEDKKVTDRTFSSFLIAPMTRVCHMPLLIEKIAKCADKLTSDYAGIKLIDEKTIKSPSCLSLKSFEKFEKIDYIHSGSSKT